MRMVSRAASHQSKLGSQSQGSDGGLLAEMPAPSLPALGPQLAILAQSMASHLPRVAQKCYTASRSSDANMLFSLGRTVPGSLPSRPTSGNGASCADLCRTRRCRTDDVLIALRAAGCFGGADKLGDAEGGHHDHDPGMIGPGVEGSPEPGGDGEPVHRLDAVEPDKWPPIRSGDRSDRSSPGAPGNAKAPLQRGAVRCGPRGLCRLVGSPRRPGLDGQAPGEPSEGHGSPLLVGQRPRGRSPSPHFRTCSKRSLTVH